MTPDATSGYSLFDATSGYVKDVVSHTRFISPETTAKWRSKNFAQIRWNATYNWPDRYKPFCNDRIALVAERNEILVEQWLAILHEGYFDADSQSLYVRRVQVKYDPLYSFVLNEDKMYLVFKGNKSMRFAEGKSTRFAYAYELTSNKPYVLGTMKLDKALAHQDYAQVAREQFEANRSLPNMPAQCDLACTFIAPSKNGEEKLYMLFSR